MFLYNALQCSEILFSFVRLKVIDFFEVCGIDVMKCMLSSLDLAIMSKDGKHFLPSLVRYSKYLHFQLQVTKVKHKLK